MKHLILFAAALSFCCITANAQGGGKKQPLNPDAPEHYQPSAQDFQVYPKEGFKIKCDCILQPATEFMQSARKSGRNVIGAYTCATGADAKNAVVIKINVTDESAGYKKVPTDSMSYYNAKYIAYLAADMKKKGFTTTEVMVNGILGLECTGTQNAVPTMLLILLKMKRIYTLSVSAKTNVQKHFRKVTSKYELLKYTY